MGRYLDPSRYPAWGLPVLAILVWHGWHTVANQGAANLLFICYAATLLLGSGILARNPLLACTGAGWLLAGFPLWFYDAIANGDWEISCIAFHVSGLVVGLMVLRRYPMPKGTGILAIGLALLVWLLSRLLTPETLNINAAFTVYRGWEGLFANNYWLFVGVSIAFFSLYFWILAGVSRLVRVK